jgi:predicted membrane protein
MRQRNRREAGEGQLGCLIGLIVLLLALFVAYKMIPVKVKAAELRQTVVDEAKSAGTHNDDVIRANILYKAKENGLPVKDEDIKIKRGSGQITVDVEYDVPIDFPGHTYVWHLHHSADNPIF